MSAFKEICLENLSDEQGQISTAENAAWGLKERSPADGQRRFRSDRFALGTRPSDESCAVTAELDSATKLKDVESAFTKVLGSGEPQSLGQPDSVYWLIETQPDNRRRSIALKVSNKTGANLATFVVAKL
ncbi:MAG TPA: hypothetical protein VIC34_04610 [Croceibacterium sp.]